MRHRNFLNCFLFIFALCLALPQEGAALSARIIELDQQIDAQLRVIVDKTADPEISQESLRIAIERLDDLVRSMEYNLKNNLKTCEKAPYPPDGSAALSGLLLRVTNTKGSDKTQKEYDEKRKIVDEYKNKIEQLKEIKKRAKNVLALINSAKAGKGSIDIITPSHWTELAKQLLKKWYEDFERKIKTGERLPPGKKGKPVDLIDNLKYTNLFPGYEASQNYIKNRTMEYSGQGEDFNSFCIRKWEFEYSRTYDPEKFVGWYDQDLKTWKQSYIIQYVDQDIKWLESKLKEAEKELEKIKKRLDEERKNLTVKKIKYQVLWLKLHAILKKTYDWGRFEKMESTIEVSVVDDSTSQDINNVSVTLIPPNGSSTQIGTPVLFDKLPNGSYTVHAQAPGYVDDAQGLTISKCGDYPVDIRLKRKPLIRIVGIVDDHTGQPLNIPIDLSIVDTSRGGLAGRATYTAGTSEFTVDPGTYEIQAKDASKRFALKSSVHLTLAAGDVREVTLRMRLKSKFVFVIELFDNRSGLKIDPPTGRAPVPSASLEPLDGQPQPSGAAYQGNGELHFDFVHLGRYGYKANFCGWNYQEGVLTIVPANISGPRVVKQVRLQPASIDSYTVRVREQNNRLVQGFSVAATGLGPRAGEPVSVVIGRDPANPNYAPAYGSFRIQGPVYSGRYRIRITHPCYKPYTRDLWLVFCGNNRSVYTPQEFHLEPDPKYVQARLLAKRAIDLTRKINSDSRTILDLYDSLKIRRAELKSAIDRFKKDYQGKNLNKQKRQKAREVHADLKGRLQRHRTRVQKFKEQATDLAKKVEERKSLLEQLKSFGAQLDCLKNDPLFKDDLRLLSQNPTQLPEDLETHFEPPLSLPPLPNFAAIEKCEAALAKAQALLPSDISGAQKLLTKVESECQGMRGEIDQAIAALRAQIEKLIAEHLEVMRRQLAACRFEAAKQNIAKLPAGLVRQQAGVEFREAVEGEKRSGNSQKQAQNQAAECRYGNALARLNEAKAQAKCSKTREKINQQISRYRKAQQYEKRTLQIYDQAQAAYGRCDYALAMRKLTEARNHTRCARHRQTLESKAAIIKNAINYEAGTKALINQAKKAYGSCRYSEALNRMRQAKKRTSCGKYRKWVDQNLAAVNKAVAREKKTRQLYAGAQKNIDNCQLSQARSQLNQALHNTGCKAYREKIKQKLAALGKTDNDAAKAKALYEKAKQAYSGCKYQQTLATLRQALASAPCGDLGKTLNQKIGKVNATIAQEAKSQALYNEANAFYKRCNFANARQKLNQAIQQSPCRRRRQVLSQKIGKLDTAQKNLNAAKREHGQIISSLQAAVAGKDCSNIAKHQKDLSRLNQLEQGACSSQLDRSASSRLKAGIGQLAKTCKTQEPPTEPGEKVWNLVETKLNPHNWPSNTTRNKKLDNSYIDNWNISEGGLTHHYEWWQWGGPATRGDINASFQAPPATIKPGQSFTLSHSASATRKEHKSAFGIWLGYGIDGTHGTKVTGKRVLGVGDISSQEWRPSDSGQCTYNMPKSLPDEFMIFNYIGGKGHVVQWKYRRKGSTPK